MRELDFRFYLGDTKIGAPFHGLRAFFTTPQVGSCCRRVCRSFNMPVSLLPDGVAGVRCCLPQATKPWRCYHWPACSLSQTWNTAVSFPPPRQLSFDKVANSLAPAPKSLTHPAPLPAVSTSPQLSFTDKVANSLALGTSPIVRSLFDPEGGMRDVRALDSVSFTGE